MDLSITLLGLSLVVIAIAPIIYAVVKRSREGKKLQQVFDKMVLQHDLQLTERDSWNDRFIGIDIRAKKLLFLSAQLPEGKFIDLSMVSSCKITKEGEDNQGGGKKEVVGNLGLQFKFKGQHDLVDLNFYDINTDDLLQANFHRQLIAKWYQLVTDAMPKVRRSIAA